MAHFMHSEKSRFDKTPKAWLPVGSQINELVNDWAGRSDIVTFIGEGAGHGAPACFVPGIAEMEVNVDVAFGEGIDPIYIGDLTKRSVQFDHPVAVGAVMHEAFHAKHSKFDIQAVNELDDKFVSNLIMWFEESRIECRAVAALPKNRAFLRACALRIVIGDLAESEDFSSQGIKAFSQLMLLSLARVDADVLDADDVTIVHDAAVKFFGEEILARLRSVWVRAQKHKDDHEFAGLQKLAEEWVKILEDSGNDPKDDPSGEGLPDWLKELLKAMVGEGSPDGEGGDGPGEPGEGDGPGMAGGILAGMAEDAEVDSQSEANAQAVSEVMEQIAEAKAAAAAESKEMADSASEVFGRGTGPGPAYTSSRLTEKRPPNTQERVAAVALAKDFDRARYRDRIMTKRGSVVPPGRLSAKRALAANEQRSRGAEVTATPWTRKMRKHTDDPELRVGVLVDISGSMGSAMQPMASTAWILSEATRRVQGKCAMVYFGNDAFPVLAPGQHLEEVNVYSAPDGTEVFDKAFKALEGSLNLLNSSGARLLVIVSDLYHTAHESAACKKWVRRCVDAGVAVVIVPMEYEDNARDVVKGMKRGGIEMIPNKTTTTDIVGAAKAIGAAAVRQLETVSS